MDQDLDEKLRRALRPVEPDVDLAQAVLARIEADPRRSSAKISFARRWQLPLALAASVAVVAVALGIHWKQQQDGLRARQQLIEALELTSAKLDLVHRIVHDRGRTNGGERNGAG